MRPRSVHSRVRFESEYGNGLRDVHGPGPGRCCYRSIHCRIWHDRIDSRQECDRDILRCRRRHAELQLLVTNSGFAPLLGPVTVSDDIATVACPAVNTVGDSDDYFDPGESITCTATYTVTAGGGTP